MYQALFKRDQFYLQAEEEEFFSEVIPGNEEKQLFDVCENRISLIKVMSVCALIMEITRKLTKSEKDRVRNYCQVLI